MDFIANRQDERIYIQVAYVLIAENTEREFAPLEAIPDNYPKMVISTDYLTSFNRKGIYQKNILTFLREK